MKQFWDQHPALFFGLHLLVGAAAVFYPHPAYLLALPTLWLPLFATQKGRILKGALLCIFSLLYTLWLYPPLPAQEQLQGSAHFHISTVRILSSPFQRSLVYQGEARILKCDDGLELKHIPCQIYLPQSKERAPANRDYLITGTFIKKGLRTYLFKPQKEIPWQAIDSSHSFAEWRYMAKEKVRLFLKEHLANSSACAFLTALTIGEVDERVLALEFAKIGLQHILGISGFHFVLLAGFLGLGLRLFLPFKWTGALLLLLLTGYFFFVGNAPAVMRGYVAISVYLVGRLLGMKTSALNALGVGLCAEILFDPFLVTQIGFQLSFLCTVAILLLYPPMNQLMARLLPKRPLSQVITMSTLDQHGYLLSAFTREAFALNLAVHLASTPLVLFLFHKFPLMSLLYNLFCPLWSSLAFILFLLATLVYFLLPPLGTLLFQLTNSFTALLLQLTSHPPASLDFSLHTSTFPFTLLILFLCLLFYLSTIKIKTE